MEENLLKSVDLKLTRILVQMSELNNQILLWESENDIEFKVELIEENLGYRVITSQCTNPDKLDQWSLLIGEIFHNLRSSLDNLAFAIARIQKDPPENPNQIYFPIFQNRDDFNKTKIKLSKQISDEAMQLIEMFQPFQRINPLIDGEPNTDALAILNWLNIIDKHRIPTILLLVPNKQVGEIKIKYLSEGHAKMDVPPQITFFGYPIQKNSIIIEYKTKYPLKEVNGKYNYNVQLCLEGPNGAEELSILIPGLYNYVQNLVNYFRHLFKKE